jgi:hypothetical protein
MASTKSCEYHDATHKQNGNVTLDAARELRQALGLARAVRALVEAVRDDTVHRARSLLSRTIAGNAEEREQARRCVKRWGLLAHGALSTSGRVCCRSDGAVVFAAGTIQAVHAIATKSALRQNNTRVRNIFVKRRIAHCACPAMACTAVAHDQAARGSRSVLRLR